MAPAWARALILALALTAGPGGGARAEDDRPAAPRLLLDNAALVAISAGSPLSDMVRKLGSGGYELADGKFQSFAGWYDSRWRELNVTFLTELDQGFGLYWGLSSGERGAKYTIAPGAKLGFILQQSLAEDTTVTFSGLFSLWGRLKERPCIADYGEIGGLQQVNCRLAASPLPPSATLDYLLDESPPDWAQFSLSWVHRF